MGAGGGRDFSSQEIAATQEISRKWKDVGKMCIGEDKKREPHFRIHVEEGASEEPRRDSAKQDRGWEMKTVAEKWGWFLDEQT